MLSVFDQDCHETVGWNAQSDSTRVSLWKERCMVARVEPTRRKSSIHCIFCLLWRNLHRGFSFLIPFQAQDAIWPLKTGKKSNIKTNAQCIYHIISYIYIIIYITCCFLQTCFFHVQFGKRVGSASNMFLEHLGLRVLGHVKKTSILENVGVLWGWHGRSGISNAQYNMKHKSGSCWSVRSWKVRKAHVFEKNDDLLAWTFEIGGLLYRRRLL